MTISRVGTQAGAFPPVDGATTASRAFPSDVTVGNVVYFAAAASDSSHTFVAGDCTKSAGTATIGTVELLGQVNQDTGDGFFIPSAVWAAKVTGTGSLTLQAGGLTSGAFWIGGSGEYNSDVGWPATLAGTPSSNGTATDSSTPATTGNATSTGAAVFVAVMGVGAPAAITIGAPGNSFSAVMEEEDGAAHMCGAIADRVVTTGTVTGGSWTLSSGTAWQGWAAVVGVINESAAAASADVAVVMPVMRPPMRTSR